MFKSIFLTKNIYFSRPFVNLLFLFRLLSLSFYLKNNCYKNSKLTFVVVNLIKLVLISVKCDFKFFILLIHCNFTFLHRVFVNCLNQKLTIFKTFSVYKCLKFIFIYR